MPDVLGHAVNNWPKPKMAIRYVLSKMVSTTMNHQALDILSHRKFENVSRKTHAKLAKQL